MKKKKTYKTPKKVDNNVQQKRNQIYAWILALAMVFWTIASVLGIVGFARTFAVDASAEDMHSNYVAKERKGALTDDERNLSSYEIDLHLTGATCFYRYVPYGINYYGLFEYSPSLIFYRDRNVVAFNTDHHIVEFSSTGVTTSSVAFRYTDLHSYSTRDGNVIFPELAGEPVTFSFQYVGSSELANFSDRFISSVDVTAYHYFNDADEPVIRYEYKLNWTNYSEVGLGFTWFYIIMEGGVPAQDTPYYYIMYPSLSRALSMSYGVEKRVDIGNFDTEWVHLYPDLEDMARANEQSGYNSGYNDGYETGSENGYYSGYNNGYSIGKEDGYLQGVAEANEYSFNGLFASVFDVPVKTFTSLFNFDVLGVNLSGLFFSILTIGIILAVVKWILP